MNMEEYVQALEIHVASRKLILGDGESVLSLLYEAYGDINPMYDDQIKADFAELYQELNGTPEESVNSSGVLFIFDQQFWKNISQAVLCAPAESGAFSYANRSLAAKTRWGFSPVCRSASRSRMPSWSISQLRSSTSPSLASLK